MKSNQLLVSVRGENANQCNYLQIFTLYFKLKLRLKRQHDHLGTQQNKELKKTPSVTWASTKTKTCLHAALTKNSASIFPHCTNRQAVTDVSINKTPSVSLSPTPVAPRVCSAFVCLSTEHSFIDVHWQLFVNVTASNGLDEQLSHTVWLWRSLKNKLNPKSLWFKS